MHRELAREIAHLFLQALNVGDLEILVNLALQGLGAKCIKTLSCSEPVHGGKLAVASPPLFETSLGFFLGGGIGGAA